MHDIAASPGRTRYHVEGERPRLGDLYLHWLAWVLLGYAILGKGFAYLGFSPLYVGEVTLVLGVVALLYSGTLTHIFDFAPAKFLLATILWGGLCTLPYLPRYGIAALRDAVLWGYGVFAFIMVGVLIQRPVRLKVLLLKYRTFILLFLGIVWALFLVKRLDILTLPTLPGSSVALGAGKGGDIMVHLTGVTAFILLGMVRANALLYVLTGITFFIGATVNRGGMLSFAAAMCVFLVLKPPQAKTVRLFYGICLLLTVFALLAPSGTIKKRSVSTEQLWTNVESIIGNTSSGNLDATKNWRIDWWTAIVGYTFGGEYFWAGKGFGINLADDDGFQVRKDGTLRSPHNGHMSMLARAGVPGFILWILLQLSWLWCMVQRWLQSRRADDYVWEAVFVFLIVYWVAFMVNASFDVFLEGPMGGIWFWTLFGAGLAALHIHSYRPEVLRT